MHKKSNTLHAKDYREWLKSPSYKPTNGCLAANRFQSDVMLLALGDPHIIGKYDRTRLASYFTLGTKDNYELVRAVKDSGRLETEFSLEGKDVRVAMIFLEKHSHVKFFSISVTFADAEGQPGIVVAQGEIWSVPRARKVKNGAESFTLCELEGKIISIKQDGAADAPVSEFVLNESVVLVGEGDSPVTIIGIVEPWIRTNGTSVLKVKGADFEERLVEFSAVRPKGSIALA